MENWPDCDWCWVRYLKQMHEGFILPPSVCCFNTSTPSPKLKVRMASLTWKIHEIGDSRMCHLLRPCVWKCLWNMSGAWAPGGLTTDGETQGPGKDAKPRSGSWKPKTLPEDQLYNEQQTVLKGKYLIWGGALFSLYQNNTDFGSKPQGLMTKKIKLCVIICHSKTPGKPFKYASVLCERWCWFFLIETGKLKRRWAEWR